MGNTIRTNIMINHFLAKFKFSVTTAKMLNLLLMVIYLNHLGCCFWYFSSRYYDYDPLTWVVRNNLLDSEYSTKYITSYYWGFQTFTTIGYGDIFPILDLERIIAIIYMIFGVVFYSFAIGNLSKLLVAMDQRGFEFKQLLNNFSEFAKKIRLPSFLQLKLEKYLE